MTRINHRLLRLERLKQTQPSRRSVLDIEAACARYAGELLEHPDAAANAPGVDELRNLLLTSPPSIAGSLARLSPTDWAL